MALRQRLEGVVDISISQSEQTVAVEFAYGRSVLSPAIFREALTNAGVEVLRFQIDACGAVEEAPGRRWFVAGANRFALDDDGETPIGSPVCVVGSLDDASTPYRFTPTTIQAVAN
jgi:hypothetical protein